jgi:excisionase family DNA binding protein
MNVSNINKDGNPAAERPEDYLLTKTDLAERLRVKPRTVDNWMAEGRLPFLKLGKTVRFSWPTVKESLLRFEVGGGGQR